MQRAKPMAPSPKGYFHVVDHIPMSLPSLTPSYIPKFTPCKHAKLNTQQHAKLYTKRHAKLNTKLHTKLYNQQHAKLYTQHLCTAKSNDAATFYFTVKASKANSNTQ